MLSVVNQSPDIFDCHSDDEEDDDGEADHHDDAGLFGG